MNAVEAPFIAERFRLERPLGAGGMGVVYAAFDIQADDHPVALKMQRHPDEASTQRFLREAEILAGVRTPGIVGYRGHGQLEDGRVWIALEWLVGETLQQRLLRGDGEERDHVVHEVRVRAVAGAPAPLALATGAAACS